MTTMDNTPQGELVLRTLAMPADTNANGDIFGGWLMSQMDIGGAILAKEIAHGRVVTVRVEGMTFLRPVAVGDVVCLFMLPSIRTVNLARSRFRVKYTRLRRQQVMVIFLLAAPEITQSVPYRSDGR